MSTRAAVRASDQDAPIDETPELMATVLPKLRDAVSRHPSAGTSESTPPPDADLIKFLRGCKYAPDKAATRYNNYVAKRTELFPDQPLHGQLAFDPTLSHDLKKGFLRIMPGARDHAGRQLLLLMPGRLGHVASDDKPRRVARAVFFTMEVCLRDVETQRRGITMINDYTGFNRSNFSRDVIREVSHVIQECLPVRVGNVLINNQGLLFSLFFKIVRVFLKEKLRRRVVLIGTDRAALTKYIAPEVTPKQLGGTFDVPDMQV